MIKIGALYYVYVNGSDVKPGAGIEKGYELLRYEGVVSVLYFLYTDFIKEPEVIKINRIPEEEKQKYFDIACRHYSDTPQQVKAAKAAYALTLITSQQ